ncbi:MAG: hypothetical protein ACT4N4_13815 [Rhodospirillales bacterium]
MTTMDNRLNPGDSVLFWAEPDPAALWRGAAIALLLMAPLAFLAPAGFIAAGLASLLLRELNQRSFRFELDAGELRLKLNALMPAVRVPLADIASVTVLPDPPGGFLPLAPRSGHLVIARTDGTQLLAPGIKEAAEAAEAITRLKREAQGTEPRRLAA